jgi:dolichol-phosphate mannosyltransferase
MSLASNLKVMELCREEYWRRYPNSSPTKLKWRALAVRHFFHVLPGETILELGGGSGLWTEQLASVFKGQNRITAGVFNDHLREEGEAKSLPNTEFRKLGDLSDLPAESFDYVIGTAILCHDEYARNLQAIHRVLKPGGRMLFFEANYWNPQVFVKCNVPVIGRWAGHAECQVGMRKYKLMHVASHQGFTELQIVPYDIVHPLLPQRLLRAVNAFGFVVEQIPVLRELCGTLYISGKRAGDEAARRPSISLDPLERLHGSISVVIPCHNEEMNVEPIAAALMTAYGRYLREIIFVDDNSTDGTGDAVRALARRYAPVRLLQRTPPNGVGLALRDGYAAATGEYILTMDCDFVDLVPELRDLFEAVADGNDGAIGIRFSHESILLNYPLVKTLCNRAFHLVLSVLLMRQLRDVTNNLKIYKSHILKSLLIEQPGFAANLETGLKPMLQGYRIAEIPMSWTNRTVSMGSSSFNLRKTGGGYVAVLAKVIWQKWRRRRPETRPAEAVGS